jgi:ATP-dependent Clp endopeptidase proteolytic subunit ClpP
MNNYIINKQKDFCELLLFGEIGDYKKTDAKKFISDFNALESEYNSINIKLNSPGGSVFDGFSIYQTIKNSKAKVNIYIDGVCASIASVIMCGANKVYCSKYASIMIHAVQCSASGSAQELIDTANLMLNLQDSIIDIYHTKTGIAKEEIKNNWLSKEKWINPQEALELKLVDEIYSGPVLSVPVKNISAQNLYEAFNQNFCTIYNKTKKNNMEDINSILSFLNMKEDTNVGAVIAHLQDQKNQITDLENELKTSKEEIVKFQNLIAQEQKNKVSALIENGIKEKRIQENQKSFYLVLAEKDYENTAKIIEGITPYKSISSQLNFNNHNPTTQIEQEMTFEEYRHKNPSALLQMKKNEPDKFIALYEKQYGAKPKI